jgi:hypothetical protein
VKRALPILLALLGCQPRPTEAPPRIIPAGALTFSFPHRASGAFRVARTADAFLDIRTLKVGDGPAQRVDDRTIAYQDGDTRILHVAGNGRVEELRHALSHAKPLAYDVRLGPGLARLRVVEDRVEALDHRGVALLRTEPAFLTDANGQRRDLAPELTPNGDSWSLRWLVPDEGLTYPLDIDPAWTVTTSLAQARRNNTLHILPSGKVLAVGGANAARVNLTSVESWDPTTGSWTSAGSLQKPRAYHAASTLPSGKIFIAGGFEPGTEKTAEVFDPAAGTSTTVAAAAPKTISLWAKSTILSPSTVLVAFDGSSATFDLSTGAWTEAPYVTDRDEPRITLLASGNVLLVGGDLSQAEVFDATTKAWKNVAAGKVKRHTPEVVTLPSGKALVAGGFGDTSSELYDPIADTWTSTPPLSIGHSFGGMVVLSTGKALIMAGDIETGLTDRVELYDPIANTWSNAGRLIAPLDDFGFVALPGGKAMVAGGSNGVPVATAQVFDPQANGKPCASGAECSSGFCVDGACCDRSACSSGETCAGSGAPGTCLKKDASTCAKDGDCGSAHCVDGVCCDNVCDGICAACNLVGSEGKCTAVVAGDPPHGMRGTCPGDGACRARCGGVDKTKCTQFPGAPVVCAAAQCVDGRETSVRGCDGAGACTMAASRDCAPYRCGATACPTQCQDDSECVEGNSCDIVTRKCVITATCEGPHAVKSPDGIVTSCAPFRCAGGRCIDACNDSSACAAGFVCDVTSKRCVVPVAETSDGGCSMGAHSSSTPLTLIALLCARLVITRRRPRTRR